MPDADTVLSDLAGHIDISCVQAQHTRDDVDDLARRAITGGFVSAHVLPTWLPYLRERLEGSTVLAGSPVAFPSGGASTATKVAEALDLLAQGVQELDVVVAIGRLRSGDDPFVERELGAVVEAVDGRVPLRAILEVGRLDGDDIRRGVDAAIAAGVPWIKTGTGWSGVPTSLDHIRLIAERAAGRAALKAAGGIRDIETVRAMAGLGVTRFGMNAEAALVAVSAAKEQR
ncbi:deoxyribose-phosphate aldolase [Microbacterium trichothecenolyticum]|uniref:Deoxyribose-phosphate aldolase n=1 Tax=Microbacterium trichothecenolyticum TaxID=69370 RepID=A0ABU0TX60_MICTR|nr:deoxyribose-phosphate aldolase [Microbacterium trichothecenolyticum]MDQ1123544.1 deoxyribose-phosphate aldolase [Microbacterium trichothecenolyticum]